MHRETHRLIIGNYEKQAITTSQWKLRRSLTIFILVNVQEMKMKGTNSGSHRDLKRCLTFCDNTHRRARGWVNIYVMRASLLYIYVIMSTKHYLNRKYFEPIDWAVKKKLYIHQHNTFHMKNLRGRLIDLNTDGQSKNVQSSHSLQKSNNEALKRGSNDQHHTSHSGLNI